MGANDFVEQRTPNFNTLQIQGDILDVVRDGILGIAVKVV